MKYLLMAVVIGSIFLIGYARSVHEPTTPTNTGDSNAIVSSNGLHWHAELEIFIHGEPVEIPSNIGLVGAHNPMHTHDPDGTIHLEYESVVRKNDLRVQKFFELWNKDFTSTQLFEYTNGSSGTVTMTVNGEPNTEFENYLIQDGDQIQIRYE